MNYEQLKRDLRRDEGEVKENGRHKPYRCSSGKLTIGVGRNIQDIGISDDEADFLLDNDIDRVEQELDRNIPWWRELTEPRQRVLANMCFNMGIQTLLGFKNTLAAVKVGDYERAAAGMGASKWATQVGPRALRLMKMMREG